MSSIRLTYSGIVGLLVRLSSLATGLIFSVLVTRNLAVSDFGLYSLIGSLVAYAMFGHIISGYWITRQIARGEKVGRTGILTSGLFSVVGTIAYIIAAYFASQNTSSDFSILALGGILIPVTYISNTVDNINSGFKPQAVSYALIAFEIAKIPFGYFLIEEIEIGLTGAIIATFLALIAKTIVGLYYALPQIRDSFFNVKYFFYWIKLSWLSLYDGIATTIYVLDTLIVSLILGTTEPLAYYAVAMTISIIAGHSGALAVALGPKLIADAKIEYVRSVLRLFTLVGIPLFAAVIIFAKPLLFVLNPVYSLAIIPVYLMSTRTFVYAAYTIFAGILGGIERVDSNNNSNFNQYRKSNLFLLGTLQHVRVGQYISSLIIVVLVAKFSELSTIDTVIFWVLSSLLADITITVYLIYRVRLAKFLAFDWKSTSKYILIAILCSLISVYMIETFVSYERDLFILLPGILVSLAVAGGVYFGILFLIDDYMKTIFKFLFKKNS